MILLYANSAAPIKPNYSYFLFVMDNSRLFTIFSLKYSVYLLGFSQAA